jgi:hypothetical protein
MNKLLAKPSFWLAVAIIILGGIVAWSFDRNAKNEANIARLAANQETLLGQVEYYESENGELVASVQALTMQRDEFSELLADEKRKVESLRVRIKDLESIGEVDTKTDVTIEAPILPPDTIYINEPIVGTFEWSDPWVSVVGELHPESIKAQINITDTITIIAHRKPRGWWIFKCKGKITRYDAMSANPHTTITHIEYVELRD